MRIVMDVIPFCNKTAQFLAYSMSRKGLAGVEDVNAGVGCEPLRDVEDIHDASLPHHCDTVTGHGIA